MSKELVLQSASGKGSTIRRPNVGIVLADKAAAPTNGKAGYAPGCIWIDRLAGNIYTNEGSKTSATWVKLGLDVSGNLLVPGTLTVTGTSLLTGAVTVSGLLSESAENAITAFATGGQANAYALTKSYSRITVCAADGDSVKLPLAAPGLALVVVNDGSFEADVFPATGDAIGGQAVNTAVRLMPGAIGVFCAEVALIWGASVGDKKFVSIAPSADVNVQAETIFATNAYTIKGGSLKPKNKIRIRGQGTIATANGTLEIRVRYGGVGGVLILDTGAAITPGNADIFTFDASYCVVDVGAAGHIYGTFTWSIGTALTGTVRTGKLASIAIDTTIDKVVNVTQQNGTGAGHLTLDYFDVEIK